MSLTLTDARRIAADVAKEQDPRFEIVGAIPTAESAYTEVIVTLSDCQAEPCQMMIGVSRDASEPEFRGAVRHRLRQELDDRQSKDRLR